MLVRSHTLLHVPTRHWPGALLISGEEGTQFSLICGNSSGDNGMCMTDVNCGYWEQVWAFSPVWILSCACRLVLCLKDLPHVLFGKGFSGYVRSHELRSLRLDRILSDKWDSQMASHFCVFCGGLKGYRDIWRFGEIPHICKVWGFCWVFSSDLHMWRLSHDSGIQGPQGLFL